MGTANAERGTEQYQSDWKESLRGRREQIEYGTSPLESSSERGGRNITDLKKNEEVG